MIRFKNTEEVIVAYKEIKRPLTPDLISDLDQIDADLRDLKLPRELVVISLQCRVCNHEQTAIAPIVCDCDNLECVNCGNMTAQEKEVE